MKISLKWLNDFVDVQDFLTKPEGLADLLTKAGLEVEEISNKAKEFQNVVVGLILTKDKHPNADKLSLCQVTTGEGIVHQIICGAQNHKAGDRVVLALPGAVLPGNFAIKKALVRGVDSGGMLCSVKELGLAKESDGILILPPEATIGKNFAEYQGLDDVSFELKVTPNRADCLSHFGLAREVACLLGRPMKALPQGPVLSDFSTKSKIKLQNQDAVGCPRYCGRSLINVKIGPSPSWLAKRLEGLGMNSINNVVDVTNYVMLERGQPLHAFDAKTLTGASVVVGKAGVGEAFVGLDGTSRKLFGDELVIRDSSHVVALAGVIGGMDSGVSETTTEIFLEAAYFEPSSVRKAARSHGIQTDSAYRFSRGVDPDGVRAALDRATALIIEVAGGEAAQDFYDEYPLPVKKLGIPCSLQTVSERLGYKADPGLFETYMQNLGCVLEKVSETEWKVLPPTFRFDLENSMDLVEEYARLHGYEHIPEKLPATTEKPAAHDLNYRLRQKLSVILRGQGYSEAVNSAFACEEKEKAWLQNFDLLKKTGLEISAEPIRLVNPLSDEMNVLRSTLSFSLWKNVLDNYRQGNLVGRLFEVGKTFEKGSDGSMKEHWRLAVVAWGHELNMWNASPSYILAIELRSVLVEIMRSFAVASYKLAPASYPGQKPCFLHRGQFAGVEKEGRAMGFLGSLHPSLCADEKVRTQVALMEVSLESLFKNQPRPLRYSDFSRFQKIERDLALLMPKTLPVAEVMAEMKKAGGPLVTSVQVFDQFIGEQLPAGQRSVAFRICYQDPNGTLQDELVQESMKKILDTAGLKWGLTTR